MLEATEKPVERGLRKAFGQLNSMLVVGKSVQATAVQRRIFAIFHRRKLIAATSGRFIGMSRGLIAGFSPVAFRWQDIKTAEISAGIFGSSLIVSYLNQPDLASQGQLRAIKFSGLRKSDAQSVYRICQTQEQAWREKRRLRDLEEMRAKSGGFQTSLMNGDASSTATGDAPLERLQKAKQMLEQGLISNSEYETVKARNRWPPFTFHRQNI